MSDFKFCGKESEEPVEASRSRLDFCPCSGKCCDKPDLFTPEHNCCESVCEDCFVTECGSCYKSCCCDL